MCDELLGVSAFASRLFSSLDFLQFCVDNDAPYENICTASKDVAGYLKKLEYELGYVASFVNNAVRFIEANADNWSDLESKFNPSVDIQAAIAGLKMMGVIDWDKVKKDSF